MTRTRRDVMVAAGWLMMIWETLSLKHWLEEIPAHPTTWSAASHSSIEVLYNLRRKVVKVDVLPVDDVG
jgi:hypothetical protein